MPAYDPKRPRPAASRAEEPAPVEALLEPAEDTETTDEAAADAAVEAADETTQAEESTEADETTEAEAAPTSSAPRDADDLEVDLRDVSSNGSQSSSHEVPVAPAPNEVTTNRAVLFAAISAAALVSLIVAVLLRRRRRSD